MDLICQTIPRWKSRIFPSYFIWGEIERAEDWTLWLNLQRKEKSKIAVWFWDNMESQMAKCIKYLWKYMTSLELQNNIESSTLVGVFSWRRRGNCASVAYQDWTCLEFSHGKNLEPFNENAVAPRLRRPGKPRKVVQPQATSISSGHLPCLFS